MSLDLTVATASPFALDPDELRRLGYRAVDLMVEHLTGLPNGPVFQPMAPDERRSLMEQPLPAGPTAPDAILDQIRRDVLSHPMGNGHPRFFGWINSPPAPLAAMTELLAAALNPSCAGGDHAAIDCDANADSTARTYAVKPATGASPILLANAGSPGVSDGAATALADTLPKTSPFQTKQGKGKLFWYTVASRREPGLRKRTGTGQQLLWMFAVNPAEVLAGKDGSYTGFFLPFQDLQTSNHLGQWTEKVVSATPPPPPPAPPPPPPPPSPPVPR